MESSIFFNDLTVIDFSLITKDGLIVGGSATLNLELSGPIDSHEGVVVDFSAGKKQIKALIDGIGGFDHKCWVNVDEPNIIIEQNVEADTVKVTHRLSGLTIEGETDMFSWIHGDRPEDEITKFLNERLSPYIVSNVFLNTSVIPVPTTDTTSHIFRYVHGLKYSTSHGCKNLVHGHKSYISAKLAPNADKGLADRVLASITSALDGTIFADAEDTDAKGLTYKVSYSTKERGHMSMSFTQKFIVLETQTTVEHLVEYIRARYYDQLTTAGVVELYVSEGLCKGAKALV